MIPYVATSGILSYGKWYLYVLVGDIMYIWDVILLLVLLIVFSLNSNDDTLK